MGKPALLLAFLATLFIGAAALAQTAPGRSVLKTLGLRGGPAHYTELEFTSPRSIPLNFVQGGLLHLDFDIHNVEGVSRAYAWQVVRTPEVGPSRRAARGVVLAGEGETVHVTALVRIPCRGRREQVTVRLVRPRLELSYGAGCLGPARR